MPAPSHTPARAAKPNRDADCIANAGSSATHKRGQMAECPRQRLPQRGLQNPKATCIAKTFGFLLRTIATKYANHRASGYPDAVAAIWAYQIIAFLAFADRNPKRAHGTETPSGQTLIWQVVIRSLQKPPRITTNHLARVRNTGRLMQTFAGRKRAEALLHAIAAKWPNCCASGYPTRLQKSTMHVHHCNG